MAAESNTGFRHEDTISSALNRHAISFQSGAINSTSDIIPMGSYFGVSSTAGMMYSGNSSIINNNTVISQAGNPCGSSQLLDSVPGLKHDTGLAVEWSVQEQYILDEGLVKYADEPRIMRYIKIAATLRDKTVRDVALRCRWMMRKRRKPEEHNIGKKVNSRKDKLAESSSKTNLYSTLLSKTAAYSPLPHSMNQNESIYEVSGISGPAKHLLEQNAQAFNQITANLSTYKLQDNINLLCCTRDNISNILNDMREMPGIMSQMPPLPVFINEDLANSILPRKP
ncbi:DUF3755 family protein [Quillaja saponaria]|uniref:DUF3755 family protein n=1 Tax=Quillaja saponaria TaxID=32244 RepID=A0AAD7PGY5_QUISA|nr:DUF3755 family protein [Quillaja saponaria]